MSNVWSQTHGTKALRVFETADQCREEWLEYRRKGIGGSDIAAVCGANPWSSAIRVYLDKLNKAQPQEENEKMFWGRVHEPTIAKVFSDREKLEVERCKAILQHPDNEIAFANIDYLIKPHGARKFGILEIKTTGSFTAEEDWNNKVPFYNMVQIQWYLYVTGFQYGYFAILIQGNKLIIIPVERDEELIQSLVIIGKQFWMKHVLTETEPEPDGSESARLAIQELYPNSVDNCIMLPDIANEYMKDYLFWSGNEKEGKKKKLEPQNKLKGLLKDNSNGETEQYEVSWKTDKRGVRTMRVKKKKIKPE